MLMTTTIDPQSVEPLSYDALYDPLPLAASLIRCPSVTPAEGGALAVVSRALAARGFSCRRLDFAGASGHTVHNLVAHIGSGSPHVGFFGHVDVVPPGDGWTLDPFAGELRGDVLYGRGACDMKGAIACFVAAVSRFCESRRHGFPGTISVLLTGDEEHDSDGGAAQMLPHLAAMGDAPDICIVGEPTSHRTPGDTIKIGRRGQMCGTVRARGVQGHSAYPDRADNPLPRLLRFLSQLGETALDQGSAHFAPSTVSITSVDVDNPATNLTPAQAEARFDIRFNDCHTRASLESRLRRLAAGQLSAAHELELRCTAEPFVCTPGRWHEVISRAVREVIGRPPEMSTGGGTSDARFIHPYCPVVELGLVGASMHRPDEHVSLADLDSLTTIYTLMLEGLGHVATH